MRPELTAFIHDPLQPGYKDRLLGSTLNEVNLRRVLTIMLDEQEFLSPFGIRAVSRFHQDHPYIYRAGDQEYRVAYLPGDSNDGMFGGNSNWRGPVWMPVNMLIVVRCCSTISTTGIHSPSNARPVQESR